MKNNPYEVLAVHSDLEADDLEMYQTMEAIKPIEAVSAMDEWAARFGMWLAMEEWVGGTDNVWRRKGEARTTGELLEMFKKEGK